MPSGEAPGKVTPRVRSRSTTDTREPPPAMLLSSLIFLLFASIAAVGAGAIARHFRGRRAGWVAGISTLLAFVFLYLALYTFVMVPLGELG